jgi:hypothetical protein
MFKSDKYFELIKATKPPEVILAYKNRNSPLIYSTGLANKDFTLLLTFSFTPIFFRLNALLNAFLGRQSHNNVLIAFKTRFLFQLNRNKIV